jgi:DNA mismatch repair ATPase MutS
MSYLTQARKSDQKFDTVKETRATTHTQWTADIAQHKALRAELDTIAMRQTALMEYIRTHAKPTHAVDAKARVGASRLSAKVRRSIDELAMLDKQHASGRKQMDVLESNILTHEPESIVETGILLGFLSNILAADSKIPSDYLADLLETFSRTIAVPVNGPAETFH